MQRLSRTHTLFVVLVCGAALVAGFVLLRVKPVEDVPAPREEPPVVQEEVATSTRRIIGMSVESRPIEAYTYGTGESRLLFVGGIHGGYEWNSVLLAYEMIDYLERSPQEIPSAVTVTIVPSANPDGLYAVTGTDGRFTRADVRETEGNGAGRFNANNVDLNRNFDCKWQPESTWRGKSVSAGSAPFSEPESAALRALVAELRPAAAVFWHSQANAVYASECTEGVLPETRTLMNAYADAAGYPAVDSFDAYPITGDIEGWLASEGIPAITVELSTHETIEWEKNMRGVNAVFSHYAGGDTSGLAR